MRQTIQKQISQIETYDSEKTKMEGVIEHLQRQVEEKVRECELYRSKHEQSDSSKQLVQQQIIDLNHQLKHKEMEIKRKDADYDSLLKETKSLRKANDDTQRQIEQFQIHLKSNDQRLQESENNSKIYHDYRERFLKERNEDKKLIKNMESTIAELKNECSKLRNQVIDLKKLKEDLLTRLSKPAGAKLTQGNADITDLGDENRPTKLAEKFSELYDNEWKDALEELISLTSSDVKAIEINLEIVSSAYRFCCSLSQMHADELMHSLQYLPQFSDETVSEQALKEDKDKGATIPQHIQKDIEDIRKSLAPQMIEVVEERFCAVAAKIIQRYVQNSKQKDSDSDSRKRYGRQVLDDKNYQEQHVDGARGFVDKESFESSSSIDELFLLFDKTPFTKQFARRCAHLCWLMRIRDPKIHMVYDLESKKDDFNNEMFRYYTRTGKHMDYLVWPALFLYENGPLLSKGVAQALLRA
ncbi:hypothetical protein KUTeg_024210 [Tegillarca granosa]|uniref:Mitochondria-eating protein C-terminal domain-containing protein n=1 Tax=Tegillarca granosa TaxID=220873 RepID=A0ABQ9DWN5_TEGGR|nr:hypothetical protein KUTeg_024210 [Tegillarca granosa]